MIDTKSVLGRLFHSGGMTVAELSEDLQIHAEELHSKMSELQSEQFVVAEEVEGRGTVYKPLVFKTFEEACRAKASSTP